MPRFFVDSIDENNICLGGDDAKHIGRSLRMKIGEEVVICCNSFDYKCVISSFDSENVYFSLVDCYKSLGEPNVNAVLFQAMPKGDKMEFIIQKSVELGITEIVPVITERCISRPEPKSFAKKLDRYNKIALEAAKQCGRGIVPKISELKSFQQAIESLAEMDRSIIFYENGGEPLKNMNLQPNSSIGFMIGSEGGFSQAEVDYAMSVGVKSAWLGNRILRCETAPIAALSIIMNITNNI